MLDPRRNRRTNKINRLVDCPRHKSRLVDRGEDRRNARDGELPPLNYRIVSVRSWMVLQLHLAIVEIMDF